MKIHVHEDEIMFKIEGTYSYNSLGKFLKQIGATIDFNIDTIQIDNLLVTSIDFSSTVLTIKGVINE